MNVEADEFRGHSLPDPWPPLLALNGRAKPLPLPTAPLPRYPGDVYCLFAASIVLCT